MQIIVEISLYPLTPAYDSPINDFIQKVQSTPDIEVSPGETSTVVRGEYELVMAALQKECRVVLQKDVKSVFVIKLLNTV